MKDVDTYLSLSEKKISEQIDSHFDQLLNSIVDKINEIKKQTKIKCIENMKKAHEKMGKYLKKKKDLLDNLVKIETEL